MTEHSRGERLQSLTTEAGRALRARAKRLASLPILVPSPGFGPRRGTSPGSSTLFDPASRRRRLIPGEVMAGVAEAEAPREERSVRALAREIKRLLTEDRRRGLGVGG